MKKLNLTLAILIPTMSYGSIWDSLHQSKQEVAVELKGSLVVVEDYTSGTEAYLCKSGVKIKKGMINCIDLVSEGANLLELKSADCVVAHGNFRKYSDEFVYMGSTAEVGLLKLESAMSIRKC